MVNIEVNHTAFHSTVSEGLEQLAGITMVWGSLLSLFLIVLYRILVASNET